MTECIEASKSTAEHKRTDTHPKGCGKSYLHSKSMYKDFWGSGTNALRPTVVASGQSWAMICAYFWGSGTNALCGCVKNCPLTVICLLHDLSTHYEKQASCTSVSPKNQQLSASNISHLTRKLERQGQHELRQQQLP